MNRIARPGLVVLALLAGSLSAANETTRAPCPPAKLTREQRAAMELTEEGVKAIQARNYDAAIAKLMEATRGDRSNHTAWYNLGLAYDGQKHHADAAKAYEEAVKLSEDDAMYRLRLGLALYMDVVPEDGANFEPAQQALETAVALNPALFRAHFYLGKIHRHGERAPQAAEAFSKAIGLAPREVDPYVALGELYRLWGYTDEAIKVLAQGQLHAIDDRSQLLYALGLAYVDKQDDLQAIEAFTEALTADKNLHAARFERGMAEFREGDHQQAILDLGEYVKSGKDELGLALAARAMQEMLTLDPGGAP